MLDQITASINNASPSLSGLLVCTLCSLICGLGVAVVYMFRNRYSRSMAVTLVLIPAIVQVIIMLVNGNIGTGIAVAGAFSLVRFRSIPGNARDIASLFLAMALGFVTGLGYVFYAIVFLVLIGGVMMLLAQLQFGNRPSDLRILRITIPENLDSAGLFDDIFNKYLSEFDLRRIRTTNLGSLYELTYDVLLKPATAQKQLIDELRCLNGNLSIQLSREQRDSEEL
jgi:hypothetical protein